MERLVRLTDAQWPRATKTGGRNAKPHRPFVEAMVWVLRTGAPWRDLPPPYGSWKSVYEVLAVVREGGARTTV